MPSLFSRTRTQSTQSGVDEHGRVKKKKSKLADEVFVSEVVAEGAFVPTNVSVGSSALEHGYLAYKREVVLGVEEVCRLTEVVCEELGARGGIATPFIFSSLALDVSMSGIRRLVDRFVGGDEHRWREEAKFAGPHELGMVLRWGLARVVRVVGGQEVRGLLSWEHYQDWRDAEIALNYPPTHFASFLPALSPPLQSIILTTLSLLTRLTAHSASSGHTPPTLSPLFGPLFFGLGPHLSAFHHTYSFYLRATHATEHLLLAFIRWQDTPRTAERPGAAAALSVPTRLKEWIKDYPDWIKDYTHGSPQARKGARTVRILSVRRNVRMYTKDLVKSASSWAYRKPPSQTAGGIEPNGLIGTREWDRISPGGSAPRYTDSYRKRLDLPSGYQPDSSWQPNNTLYGISNPGAGSTISLVSSSSSSHTTAQFRSLTDLKWGEFENLGFSSPSLLSPTLSSSSSILSNSTNATSANSSPLLPGGEGDLEKKLQFDLTESARKRSKRQTLTWNDFSSAGFSRSEGALSTSLTFSPHLTLSPNPSPSPVEKPSSAGGLLGGKLRKPSKMPVFGWDTTPVLGSESVVEEAFVDVWSDLIWGTWGGAASGPYLRRGPAGEGEEERTLKRDLDRECNWVLVEFKSLPSNSKPPPPPSSQGDERTGSTLLLFEEYVPFEYRQELAKVYGILPFSGSIALGLSASSSHSVGPASPIGGSRTRLASLFTPKSSPSHSGWKPSPTLNGRPYVVGAVPAQSTSRELEFEGLLRREGKTKVLSLDRDRERGRTDREDRVAAKGKEETEKEKEKNKEVVVSSPLYLPPKEEIDSSPIGTPTKMTTPSSKPRFRLPNPTPKTKLKTKHTPAEYSSLDFSTRFTADSSSSSSDGSPTLDNALDDDGFLGDPEERKRREEKVRRRQSRMNGEDEDAWVDILVGSVSEGRFRGQEAEFSSKRSKRDRERTDPDMASMEIAKALKNVPLRSSSEDEAPPPKRPDSDVVEIETVPRREIPGRSHPHPQPSDGFEEEMEPVSMYTNSSSPPRSIHNQYEEQDHYDHEEDPDEEGYDSEESNVARVLREARMRRAELSKGGGYFDKHPERRMQLPAQSQSPPRPSVDSAGSRYTDEEEDVESTSGLAYEEEEEEPKQPVPKPASPPQTSPSPPQGGVRLRPLPSVPVPPKPPAPSSIPVPVNPIPSIRQQTQTQNANGTGAGAGGKTAALIEMYREREKSASPSPVGLPPLGVPIPPLVPTPSPSRVPIRAPVPVPSPPAAAAAATPPAPPPKEQPALTPSPPAVPSPPVVDLEPPKPLSPPSETGRASPARYVHGAPLHNVLEEEEEE